MLRRIRTQPSGVPSSRPVPRCPRPGPKSSLKRYRRTFRRAAIRSAPRIAPKTRWKRCSARSAKRTPRYWAPDLTATPWERSKGPCMRAAVTSGRSRIASCSRATRWASARFAAAPSSALSTFIRGLHLDKEHFHRLRIQIPGRVRVAPQPARFAAGHVDVLDAATGLGEPQMAFLDADRHRVHVVVQRHGFVGLQRQADYAHAIVLVIQAIVMRVDLQRIAPRE